MSDLHLQELTFSDRPLLKINTRSAIRRTGYVVSQLKARSTIDHASDYEEAFILRAEIEPRVSEIYAQPFQLRYWTPDGERTGIPDFGIVIDGVPEYHEVKSDRWFSDKVRQDQYWRARQIDLLGGRYSVDLASQLLDPTEWRQVRDLDRRRLSPVPELLAAVVDDALEEAPATIGDLVERLGPKGLTFERCLCLIAQRHVRVDFAKPLDEDAVLHAGSGDVWFPRLVPYNSPLEWGAP